MHKHTQGCTPSRFLSYHSYRWITFLTEAAARLYDGQSAYVSGLWITPRERERERKSNSHVVTSCKVVRRASIIDLYPTTYQQKRNFQKALQIQRIMALSKRTVCCHLYRDPLGSGNSKCMVGDRKRKQLQYIYTGTSIKGVVVQRNTGQLYMAN